MILHSQYAAWVPGMNGRMVTPVCVQSRPLRCNHGLASEKKSATLHLFSDIGPKFCLRIWGDSSKNGTDIFKKNRACITDTQAAKNMLCRVLFLQLGSLLCRSSVFALFSAENSTSHVFAKGTCVREKAINFFA